MRPESYRWLAWLCVLLLLVNCGEMVPVDCTPDEEQCSSEREGGFEPSPAAGVAVGVAVVAAVAGGSSSGSGGTAEPSDETSSSGSAALEDDTLQGTLLDSAVEGVAYQTDSGLTGFTSPDGNFDYRSEDQIEFWIGDTLLGQVSAGEVITPVELAEASDTADARVINIARLLQTLDEDEDPSNGIQIPSEAHERLKGTAVDFDVPLEDFSAQTPVRRALVGRSMQEAAPAIQHLHSSLLAAERTASIGEFSELGQLIPDFAANAEQTSSAVAQSCEFAGGTVPNGGSVIAFEQEAVSLGGVCASQTRFCVDGELSGSFGFTTCSVDQDPDCEFNGISIADGLSATAFQSAVVPFGNTCTSQLRTCNNGTLTGSYAFQNCTVAEPSECNFQGASVPHGDFVQAYLNATEPAGSSCSSQIRTCFNGSLSGTYPYAGCEVSQPNCSFNGQTLRSGQQVTAYQAASVSFGNTCTSEVRTCSGGTLSGSYAFSSCSVAAGASCLFEGQTVAHNSSVTAYLNATEPAGSSCSSETRTCWNGVLQGSYSNATCSVTEPDRLPSLVRLELSEQVVEQGGSLTITATATPGEDDLDSLYVGIAPRSAIDDQGWETEYTKTDRRDQNGVFSVTFDFDRRDEVGEWVVVLAEVSDDAERWRAYSYWNGNSDYDVYDSESDELAASNLEVLTFELTKD